jgi:hypothetical protein
MLSFEKLCNQRVSFTRSTDVKIEEFCEIVEKVRPEWNKLQQKKKIAGWNSHLKVLEDEILLSDLLSRLCEPQIFGLFNLDNSIVDICGRWNFC